MQLAGRRRDGLPVQGGSQRTVGTSLIGLVYVFSIVGCTLLHMLGTLDHIDSLLSQRRYVHVLVGKLRSANRLRQCVVALRYLRQQ